jgi:transposase
MKILAIDLGKYKSVACNYVTTTGTARFATVVTDVLELDRLLQRESPDLVVIETCSIAGWVHDLCCQRGVTCQVANPSSEAWKWKNVKRKTDRDDALKLAQLAALQQLPTVHVPASETRQRRALLKYRQSLITRRVAIQNHLRAIVQREGILLDRGRRASRGGRIGDNPTACQAPGGMLCGGALAWRSGPRTPGVVGGHQAAARSGT